MDERHRLAARGRTPQGTVRCGAEDRTRVAGLIKAAEKMSQADKEIYLRVLKENPDVCEYIGNIALLSDDGRALFRQCMNLAKSGRAAEIRALLE